MQTTQQTKDTTGSRAFPASLSKLAALFLLLSGSASPALHAQGGTSPLDTAPGVPTEAKAPVAAPSPAPAAPAPTGGQLLSNDSFAAATKDPHWPDDWDKAAATGATWLEEGGKHFVRLSASQPDQHIQLYRVIDIPAGVTALEVSVRYRVTGLKKGLTPESDARMILNFLEASTKPIKAAPPIVLSASGWTTASERVAVPKNAAKLGIMPCLFRVKSGTLDLAEIHVKAMDNAAADPVVAAAATAAEKNLADQKAILDREVGAPPKTAMLKVSGNKIVNAAGATVLLEGVNVCNLATVPTGEHGILWAIHTAIDDWHARVIRLPVLDGFWFGKGRGKLPSNDQEAYRTIVDKAIKLAAGKGVYTVLDLHRFLAPDESCAAFWTDAATRYKNNPAVLFDVFNEPHGTPWDVWQKGGQVEVKGKPPVQSVGMQGLVDAVRDTGAKNIVVAAGLGYANDLSGILNGYALDDKGGNGIVYDTHFYNWHKNWDRILPVAEKYPVLVGEFGADPNKMSFIPAKAQEDPYTWSPDALGFVQKNHLNWTAWCFHTRATPNLLLDWDYFTPTPYWGAFVKEALGGRQFEMKKMR